MNTSLISLEMWVIGLGLVLMLADLFMPVERRRLIGYAAITALGVLLVVSLTGNGTCGNFGTAFSVIVDGAANRRCDLAPVEGGRISGRPDGAGAGG